MPLYNTENKVLTNQIMDGHPNRPPPGMVMLILHDESNQLVRLLFDLSATDDELIAEMQSRTQSLLVQ